MVIVENQLNLSLPGFWSDSLKLEKNSFLWGIHLLLHSPLQTKVLFCSKDHTIALISHASKIMLKILQARLQQYMNWELPDV